MKKALQAKFDAQKIAFAPLVFQAAIALRNLGILRSLEANKEEGRTAADVARELNLTEYGVEVLLDMGLAAELVEHPSPGHYRLSKTGFFIEYDDLTRANMDFVQDVCYQAMFGLEDSVRQGKPEGLKVFGARWATVYEALAELPPSVRRSWFAFDHFYSDQAFPEVLPLVFAAKPKRLLDVGGNTGKWAMLCAGYNPEVHVTILDLPGQLAEARTNALNAGLQDRIDGYEIDLLEVPGREFPAGADAIWMSQFLVCFSKDEIVRILQKAARALSPQASLFILDTYHDLQRFPASEYSLHATSLYFTAIANGNSRIYSSGELKACLAAAGLQVVREWNDIGISHTLWQVQRVTGNV